MGRWKLLIASCLAACAVCAEPAPAAMPGSVTGKINGAPVPAKAAGVAGLRAIRLDTGVIERAQRPGPSGSYDMKLPVGPYIVVATVFDRVTNELRAGKGPPFTVGSGVRRVVPVIVHEPDTKPTRKAKPKPKKAARGSYVHKNGKVTPGVKAIEVRDFTGAAGQRALMNRAITDTLQTSMSAARGSCDTILIANARDRAVIADKLKLQRSRYVGKPTTVRRNLVRADVVVRGQLANRRDALAYEIAISDSRTGRLIDTRSGEVALDDRFFARVTAIGPDLIRRICNPPPAPRTPSAPPAPRVATDTVAPVVTLTSPANGSILSTGTPVVSGLAGVEPGDSNTVTVHIYSGTLASGLPVQTLTATRGAGSAYATQPGDLGAGTFTARAQQSDATGNTGVSPANTFSIISPGNPVLIGAGDVAGCGSSDGDAQTAALLAQHPDAIIFTLGDNAYPNGDPAEFANCYGPTWGVHKARTRPATGDHDTEPGSGAGAPNQGLIDYFRDQLAPFGPTATDRLKAYYSYDVGAWHVVVLNSTCYGALPGCNKAQQEQWFRDDLAAHPNVCTAVMWHHARWSSGSVHGDSTSQQPLWSIAYAGGVDIALSGNEHNYERFAPQNASGNLDATYGVRAFVVGTGGYYLYGLGTLKPNSEAFSSTYGVIRLTLRSTSYDWRFIPVAGETFTDSGTGNCHGSPP